jgi:NADH-quinone oxidoreductase subunit G
MDEVIPLGDGPAVEKLQVNVCTGTNCFLKGSQQIIHDLLGQVQKENLQDQVDVCASFCFEQCDRGPTVSIDGKKIHHCTPALARAEMEQQLKKRTKT